MTRAVMLLVATLASAASASFLSNLMHGSHSSSPELKVCNKGHNLFRVSESTGLKVSPYPPKRGGKFTVELAGQVMQELKVVELKVDVHYGFGVKLASTKVELCGELHCPIHAGDFHLKKEVELPSMAPPGHYTITVHGTNPEGKSVVCADMKVQVN